MNFLSITDWKKNELRTRPKSTPVTCIGCMGEGEIQVKCAFCTPEGCEKCADGFVFEECPVCEDEGKVKWGSIPKAKQRELLTEKAYYQALRDDIEAVSSFSMKPLHQLAFEMELAPFTDINDLETRKIKFQINAYEF